MIIDDESIFDEYKSEPIYIFGTKVLELINKKIETADLNSTNPNLKIRLIGEHNKKELTILKYQIIDEYHKICKAAGLEDEDN